MPVSQYPNDYITYVSMTCTCTYNTCTHSTSNNALFVPKCHTNSSDDAKNISHARESRKQLITEALLKISNLQYSSVTRTSYCSF